MTTPPHLKSALILLPLLAATGCHPAPFPGYPDGFRQFAYIANSGGNTVTVLDLVYLRPDRTLRVGDNPIAIVTNPKKNEAYVLNRQGDSANGSVSIIDTRQNQVVATIPVQHGPTAISVDPSGNSAYVANTASNTVSVLDLSARRAIAFVHTADHPTSALISSDGRTLVVTSETAGSISLYSAAALIPPAPLSQSPLATQVDPLRLRSTFPGCPGATSPVILPDSSKAFIACPQSNQVLAIALAAAPDSWAGKQNASLLQDHALALLEVGQTPTALTLKPDGGEIFVSNSAAGSISEISTTTNEVGSTFGIGDQPAHGIVSADNAVLYVSNSSTDSISLYSIDDGKRLPSVHAGAGPDALAFSHDPPSGPAQRLLLAADRRSGDVAVIRTTGRQGPALFTILPAGAQPSALAIP